MSQYPFIPHYGATKKISATDTSSSTAFSSGESLLIQNSGSAVAFVEIAASADTAVADEELPILPGTGIIVSTPKDKTLYARCVCASGDSTTVFITPGMGS